MIGAATGAVLGILFAPDKGSRTRRKISGKTEDMVDSIEEKFEDFLSGIRKEVESVKDKANEMIEVAKAKADKMK